ncbi:MAG: CopG family transcriptional regulator [Deltaproteobacteria bacterium]|nr:CopG family transcriptional regulator [Deltaproteobacteria bacterium]
MKKKQDIITFKVNEDLRLIIRDIPNRSEFIRQAIVAALGSVCPLCNGSGMLSPNQKRHWEDFALHHSVKRCMDCDERVLVCSNEGAESLDSTS